MMRPWRAFIMPRSTRLRQAERRLEVGRHDRVPLVVLHAQQQVVARDAGIVDEDRRWRRSCASMSASAASIAAASVTSSCMPAPALPASARYALIVAAPSSRRRGADHRRAVARERAARSRGRCRASRR